MFRYIYDKMIKKQIIHIYRRQNNMKSIKFSAIIVFLMACGVVLSGNSMAEKIHNNDNSDKTGRNMYPLIPVKGGKFLMGSKNGIVNGAVTERPVHSVLVNDFMIGEYEVTQEVYETVTGLNPSVHHGKNLPVENVTWYEAVIFCNLFSKREGLEEVYTIKDKDVSADFSRNGYRLPTEAEWEYAARGGQYSGGFRYAGSDKIDSVAWYAFDSGSHSHEVGTRAANELGLYDMSGNVWEWCWDWYGKYHEQAQTDPSGGDYGKYRIIRGNCWSGDKADCTVWQRGLGVPYLSMDCLGFRLVRSSKKS
jgi:formylglycine-generating enzyme